MTEKEILQDPTLAMKENMDPLGNKFVIKVSKIYPGLYTIEYAEARVDKQLPTRIKGHWTNLDRAKMDLQTHLAEMWAKVEQKSKPLSKPNKESESAATA